jgi:hypothetical protein
VLIVACFFLAAVLVMTGVALTFGVGPALIVAGLLIGLGAWDSTRRPGASL